MFALCHFKENPNDNFVLMDSKDLTEITEHLNIEIVNTFSFEEFDKNYANDPLLDVNGLLLRTLNRKAKTLTHSLDQLGISCWNAVKKEYYLVQQKQSKLSHSQRENVINYYNYIKSLENDSI